MQLHNRILLGLAAGASAGRAELTMLTCSTECSKAIVTSLTGRPGHRRSSHAKGWGANARPDPIT